MAAAVSTPSGAPPVPITACTPVPTTRGRDAGRQIAVADEPDAGAGRADVGDELLVARPIEHDDDQILDLAAEALRDRVQVVGDRRVEVHRVLRARPDDELFHVEIRRMQQAAALGRGQHRDGVRRAGRAQIRAFERIDGDVHFVEARRPRLAALGGVSPCPTFSPMYSIGASSRSPSPMTIVPSIGTRVHDAAHRFDGDLIGFVPIALAHRVRAGNRRLFDDAQEFE